MTIIAIWSVFLGEVTFCEFLVCFPIIPFLRFLFGELTGFVFLWRIELRGLKLWWSWNFRSDKILEIVTLWLVFISGSEGRVFWSSSVFDCKSNFFRTSRFFYMHAVQEGRCWSGRNTKIKKSLQISRFVVLTGPAADEILELHFVRLMVLGLPVRKFSYCRLPKFVVLTGPAADEIFGAPFCKAHGLCWACQWQNFRTADCQVRGLDWACRGWNFGAPFCKAHGLWWACQWQKFSYCRLPSLWSWLGCCGWNFWAPFCKAHGLWWVCQWPNFRTADCQVCGLDWPAADEIFELHFARLMVFAGPASRQNFCTADCQVRGLDWACRGWEIGAPFCKAHALCWAPASDRIFVLQIAKFCGLDWACRGWNFGNGAPKYVRGRPSQDHKPGTLARKYATGRAQQRPCALQMKPQTFICGRPSQDHKPGNLQYENFVTGRPSKDHEPYKMELQNFIRGRPSQDHEPGNLQYENSVTGRPRQRPWTLQNGAPKFHPQQVQSRLQTWQSAVRKFCPWQALQRPWALTKSLGIKSENAQKKIGHNLPGFLNFNRTSFSSHFIKTIFQNPKSKIFFLRTFPSKHVLTKMGTDYGSIMPS